MKSLQNCINEVLGVSLRYSPLAYEEDLGVYQFGFTPDNVCKPVWNSTSENVLVLCVCTDLNLLLNSCVWTRFLPWPLIRRPVGCTVGMRGKENLWKRVRTPRILRPNLSKRPEYVWSVWTQQDYAKPKPSGWVFHLSFLNSKNVMSEQTTLWEMLSSQQPCCVPVSVQKLKCCSEIWLVSFKSQCFIKINFFLHFCLGQIIYLREKQVVNQQWMKQEGTKGLGVMC